MAEILKEILRKYGIVGVIFVVIIGAVIWYTAHSNSEEGESVSILWDMVVYTKPISVPKLLQGQPASIPVELKVSDYDRALSSGIGAGVLPYGKGVVTNLDETRRTNTAVYRLPKIAPGNYSLLVEYASAESRPVEIYLNSNLVNPDGLSSLTGGWHPNDQRWIFQGKLSIETPEGNLLKLHRQGNVFPHIRAIKFVPI